MQVGIQNSVKVLNMIWKFIANKYKGYYNTYNVAKQYLFMDLGMIIKISSNKMQESICCMQFYYSNVKKNNEFF